MADAERLTFNLSSGGDVVIKLRPVLAPRSKHQPVSALRQLPREFDAEASRSAGDQRDLGHRSD